MSLHVTDYRICLSSDTSEPFSRVLARLQLVFVDISCFFLCAYLDMNYSDDSEDSIRRLTDDLGRHRLTDVQEENEDDVPVNPINTTRRNRYSSIGSTASSLDYLWDLHPRRLSEAGLSRHSDNSTILTEDTDSFIIGQRIWVGGTKPGTIAYIGDTQFAPGEWAGIVLDQPIGKNDGSVGGTRYFQCEPKKGVFSRLTRLTRAPLNEGDMGSGDHFGTSPIHNGSRRSPISPSGSSSPFKSPPSLNNSITSLASTVVDFKLGDRVIIKSSQGSKIGVLRFIGTTDFASGEWCGVELDEPRGKNDGSVEGKRYFECRPNFGLFAPITKVSKSPSNRKPGSCVIHSGPGIPPSGFKRANSKESITSNTSITSAASAVRRKVSPKVTSTPIPTRTALQEVLKEKQQHIEQLLKERDLERAEIARAASQADEAEQKYVTLKQDYEQYKTESEKKFQEHVDLLVRLKLDREVLLSNLEDEKRKNEDLQFRFEEAAITKSDVEQRLAVQNVANETNVIRLKELEELVAAEQRKIDLLEGDSNRLFEAEETLARIREENEILRYEVEVATTKILAVESECFSAKDLITSLKREINELQIVLGEKDETIEKITIENNQTSSDFNLTKINLNKELDDFKQKCKATSDECLKQKTQIELLETKVSHAEKMLDEKTQTLKEFSSSSKDFEEKMNKGTEKLKMELSAKILDLETSNETLKAKDKELQTMKSQFELLCANIETQNSDIDKYKENVAAIENTLRKELDESRSNLKAKIAELEEAKKEFANTKTIKDNELAEANKKIETYMGDVEKLKAKILQTEESFGKNTQDFVDLEQKLKDADVKITTLTSEINKKDENLNESMTAIRTLENEISVRNENLQRFENELNTVKQRLQSEGTLLKTSNETIGKLRLNIGDLERSLKISEEKVLGLTEQKSKLENEIQSLIDSSGDYGTKLDELTKELRGKDNSMELIKKEYTEKFQEIERSKQELELNHKTIVDEMNRDKLAYEEKIKQLNTNNEELKQRYENRFIENNKTIEELNLKFKELQNIINEKNQLVQKLQEDSKTNEAKMKEDLEKTDKLFVTISGLQNNVSRITKENDELKDNISKMSKELIETETKHNQFVENSKQNQTVLELSFEEKLQKLEFEITEREAEKVKSVEKSKLELVEKLEQLELIKQELELNYNKLNQDMLQNKIEYDEHIKNMTASEDSTKHNYEKIIDENRKTISDLKLKVEELESISLEKDTIVKNIQQETEVIRAKLNEELTKSSNDLQINLLEAQKKIDSLIKENDEMKRLITQKTTEILERDTEHKNLVEKSQLNETKVKKVYDERIQRLEDELTGKNLEIQQLNSDIEEIKNRICVSKICSNERDAEIMQLKSELKINHQFVDKLKLENDTLLKQQEEIGKAQELNSQRSTQMAEKIKQLTEDLEESNNLSSRLQSVNNNYATMLKCLKLNQKQKLELLQNIKHLICVEGDVKLTELVENIEVKDEQIEEKNTKLNDELLKYMKLYQEVENKMKLQDTEITRLENELTKNLEISRTTKATSKIAVPVSSKITNNNPLTNKQLIEEKLFAESQVAFLNSIIIDMQKKNEEQKARIEILESGYSPAAADELKLFGMADRNLPPRMYCDICEEFDLHETEDCPQQANDDLPSKETSPKEKPPQRPYCDICEAFGHLTEDCQEDQTF